MTQRTLKLSSRTIEGPPCKTCGSTLRYIKIPPSCQADGVKVGRCASCSKRSESKSIAKKSVRKPEIEPKEEWGYEDYDI